MRFQSTAQKSKKLCEVVKMKKGAHNMTPIEKMREIVEDFDDFLQPY